MAIKDSVLNVVIKAQDEATDTLTKFKAQIVALDRAANDAAGDGLEKVERDIQGIDRAAQKAASGPLDAVADDIDDVGDEANKAAPKLAKFGERQRTLYEKLRLQALQQPGRKVAKDIRTSEVAATQAGLSFGNLARKVGGLIAAYAGFEAVRRTVGSIIQTGDQFEKLGIQLEAVEGSAKGARDALNFVEEFTKKTPLQLEQVTEAYTKLRNFGIDPTNGTLQALVDQNEKLGGGYERLNGLILAVGQAWGKSKLQGEEILQLIERGVPVWQLLEEATGKNVQELQKLSAAGKLGRNEIKLLIDQIGASASGAAVANMATFSGLVSNLRDSWAQFANTVAEAGVLDYIKRNLKDVSDAIKRLSASGQLDAFAKSLSDAMIVAGEALKGVVQGIGFAIQNSKLLFQLWAAFKFAAIATRLGAVTAGMTAYSAATRVAIGVTNLFKTALRAIPFFALTEAILTVGDAIRQYILASNDLKASQEGLATVTDEAAKRIAQYNEQTGESVQTLDELLALVDSGQAIFDAANQRWITGAAAVEQFKNSTGVATEEQVKLTGALYDGVDAFKAAQGEAETTAEALEAVFDNYDLNVADDVFFLANTLQKLSEQGEVTAQDLQESLGTALEDLSVTELNTFVANATRAFKLGAIEAETFANVIDTAVGGALEDLGVDLTLAETGIGDLATTAIQQFQLVVQSIQQTGDTAEVASKKVSAAFTQALATINTNAGFDELKRNLVQAAEAGVISTAEYNKKLKELIEAQKAFNETTKATTASAKELKKTVDEIDASKLDDVTDAAAPAGSVIGTVATAANQVNREMAELGPKAQAAFADMLGVAHLATQAVNDLDSALAQAQTNLAALTEYRVSQDITGIGNKLNEMAQAGERVKIAFYSQAIAVRNLQQAYQAGTIELNDFIYQAERAIDNAYLLDNQQLNGLRSAIIAARREMEAFADSTEDTLTRLQNRLDRLNDDTAAIVEREYLRDIAKLEAELAQARANRDEESIRNLTEALRIRREIYNLEKEAAREADRNRKERDRELDREKKDRRDPPKKPPRDPLEDIFSGNSGGNSGSNRTVTLNLSVGGGPIGSLTNVDQDELERLIEALERAGLTGG